MFVEHEKNSFFSLLKNTRSGGISQGRAFFARRVPGFPHERSLLVWDGVSGRSAAESLYGCRSGGYGHSVAETQSMALADVQVYRLRQYLLPGQLVMDR